jgi:DNA-directed RNA polymerase subunit H (RpoH/RPB5)
LALTSKEYRGYTPISPRLDEDKFDTQIGTVRYIKIDCKNGEDLVTTILFDVNSDHIRKTENFRTILRLLHKDLKMLILVSDRPIMSHIVKNVLPNYSNFEIYRYYHRMFITEAPKGPLVGKHRIMTPEEVIHCTSTLHTKKEHFSRIFDTDPQCAWLGAKVGDMIQIDDLTETTGFAVYYMIVVENIDHALPYPGERKHYEIKKANESRKKKMTEEMIEKKQDSIYQDIVEEVADGDEEEEEDED